MRVRNTLRLRRMCGAAAADRLVDKRSVSGAGLLCVLLSALLLGGCHDRAGKTGPDANGTQQTPPARIVGENGRTVITLDAATRERLGIVVNTLAARAARAQATYPAVVLNAEPLAESRAKYLAMESQQKKAQIRAEVARKQYERLKALSGPERNVSEKSLQAAEAVWQGAEADARAAAEQLELQTVALSHNWGDVVAKWAATGAPEMQNILARSQSLLQLTMPAGSASLPPRDVSLLLPDGSRVTAKFVSAFPRVDPRIQGRSFLYRLPSRGGLAPGLSLVARFAVGERRKGVMVPVSAVLWSEGKAWVYEELAPGRYTRVPVSTELPVENGYLAPEGLAAGGRVVTVGAQELLSEEILLHSQGGDED
jgi:hypothetical protein